MLGVLALLVLAAACSRAARCRASARTRRRPRRGHETYQLWQGFTIGAIVVGGITLVLIVYAAIRYRVRADDEGGPAPDPVPPAVEIVYTIIPILIVLVLFAFTVVVENDVTALPTPAATIRVDAFQWGWRFTYPGFTVVGQTTQTPDHGDARERAGPHRARSPSTSCTASTSRDFNFSRQALPGVVNQFTFDATPDGHVLRPVHAVLRAVPLAHVVPGEGGHPRAVRGVAHAEPDRRSEAGRHRRERRRPPSSSTPTSRCGPTSAGGRTSDRADRAPGAGGGDVVIVDEHHDAAHDAHEHHEATGILKWLTSTDHKVIGLSYTITSLVMFVIGGCHGRDDPHPAHLARTTRSSRSPSSTSSSRCTAA